MIREIRHDMWKPLIFEKNLSKINLKLFTKTGHLSFRISVTPCDVNSYTVGKVRILTILYKFWP